MITDTLGFQRSEIEGSLIARWQSVVDHFPNESAVIDFGGTRHTYAELEQASDRLAQTILCEIGAHNCPVILLLDHSIDLITAILGALKANKAYVALDPGQTIDQLEQLIRITGASVIVTERKYRDIAESIAATGELVWSMDSYPSPKEMPAFPKIDPDAIAGIFFTSGTINKPKGVPRTHRTILHRTWYSANLCRFGPGHRISGVRQSGLGSSVADLFNALLNGATYCIYPMKTKGLHGLTRWLRDSKITYFHPPIALYRQWLDSLTQEDFFPDLRHILPSGRKSKADIDRIWPHVPADCVVLTSYSSTETTQISCRVVDRQTALPEGVLDVGQPLPDKRVTVVDQEGVPVGIGDVGEIVVQSRYISSEYWHQAALTAERFEVLDPTNETAYRTGDFGRQRSDGCLELIGRRDSQIKLRGYRVMLDEVEDALRALPTIKQVAVTADEERGLLYAYIIAASDPPVRADEIRYTLADHLPDYCVPTHFIYLQSFPLLANGKVNRQALPTPESSRPLLSTPYTPPRTTREMQLRTICEEVLGIEGIGVNDDFFDLGGHSLSATRFVSRVRDVLRVELPLRSLFENPTIAAIALAIDAVNDNQILTAIKPAERTGNLPLSFGEERLWFLHQLEPDSPNYTVFDSYRLTGTLNIEALESSFVELLRRHEILRTTYRLEDEGPVRIIADARPFTLPVTDISGLSESEPAKAVKQRILDEGRCRFDLEDGPLFTAKLLRLAPQEHVLSISQHHIVTDGTSIAALWRELETLYRANCYAQPSPLPDLPIQYADFACWQRLRKDKIVAQQLSYWMEQLKNAPPLLNLPTDHPRPTRQEYRGATFTLALPASLTESIHELNRQSGCTLFMTLLAAFYVLLFRYSDQDDVVVSTPIANRTASQIEGLLGFFLNTLALRATPSSKLTFSQLLAQVRNVALDAYQHQDLPFEKLVEELQPDRSLSHHPLFQVMFMLRDAAPKQFSLSDVTVSREPKQREAIKFDLRLVVDEVDGQFSTEWDYSLDLFEESTIRRMAGHFQALLEQVVVDPEQSISDYPLLTAVERHQLLVEWNCTGAEFAQNDCIHALVEQQVEQRPDAVAVCVDNEALTYGALNQRADQLARHLRSQGVGPGNPVGLCLERSTDLVVGILAILKAGGAYIPLDPDYPMQRLAFMFSDAAIMHVVTQRALKERLPHSGCCVTCVDEDAAKLASEERRNISVDVDTLNLAYVMYTSGSTGHPKGVAVAHRSVTNLLTAIRGYLDLGDGSRFLGLATPTFDISVAEIFLPLISGATTILVRKKTAQDPYEITRTIAESRANIVQATPATWQLLLEADWPGDRGLTLISTGEALAHSLAAQLLKKSKTLHDFYGPTETTIWSTVRRVTTADAAGSIGRPIANTQVYLLDKRQQPVPIGVPAELYIGGAGISRGYLNRPELTAEKFVPNPFSTDPGARLYRTGDLCRWRKDGSLAFLGRIDDQVKLHGFRIELGEIEIVLGEHPQVAQCTVVLGEACEREDRKRDQRLIAYYVPTTGTELDHIEPDRIELDHIELRNHLRTRLPDYMLPQVFVALDALPLTPSGKINRRALPEPVNQGQRLNTKGGAPSNATEQQLVAIWNEVLGIEKVGIDDNFFELGGHSIMAVRLVSRVRDQFQIELPLRSLFEWPIVAELAAHIAQLAAGSDDQRLKTVLAQLKRLSSEEQARLLSTTRTASQADSSHER